MNSFEKIRKLREDWFARGCVEDPGTWTMDVVLDLHDRMQVIEGEPPSYSVQHVDACITNLALRLLPLERESKASGAAAVDAAWEEIRVLRADLTRMQSALSLVCDALGMPAAPTPQDMRQGRGKSPVIGALLDNEARRGRIVEDLRSRVAQFVAWVKQSHEFNATEEVATVPVSWVKEKIIHKLAELGLL